MKRCLNNRSARPIPAKPVRSFAATYNAMLASGLQDE